MTFQLNLKDSKLIENMQLKNILVPVDFSKCSKNALRIAIKIAKKADAKIHMVNAVHVHAPHPNFAGENMIEGVIKDYETQVKQSFQELESEIIELKDVPHDADRFLSYLTDAIFSECTHKDIDLIVMGTRSDHDKVEQLVGTHATDIIETSDVPVLIIPENCTSFEPKKIGFGSDFSKFLDYGRIDRLIWFSNNYDSETLVFHITDDPSSLSENEQREIDSLKAKLGEVNSSIRTSEADSPVEGILSFVDSHDLDMLALMPRKRGFFEKIFRKSVTKEIAIDPKVPLLTLPDL